MLTAAILSVVLTAGPNPKQLEVVQDGVRLRVDVESDLYTWTIENEAETPVTSFEIASHNVYNHTTPAGWSIETDVTLFRAWADGPEHAIRKGGTGTFSGRVTSTAAILGAVPTTVGCAEGDPIEFEGIWGPIAKPQSHVWLVAGILSGLALLHWLVIRRRP